MLGPVFFLSYAREDREDDPYQVVDRFYDDLVRVVAGRLGCAKDEVGFLDTENVQTGDQWPGKIEDALRTCRAFVPVLSPRYLTRPYCGKEWAAFRSRISAENSSLILPILLQARHYLKAPTEVTDINDSDDTLPDLYRKHGLDVLVRQGDRKAYEDLISAFASRLITVTQTQPLEPANVIPPLASLRSSFDFNKGVTPRVAAEEDEGPRWAHFILVAARRDEVTGIRHGRLDAYSQDPTGWRPWHPEIADEVSYIVAEVAVQQKLLPKWVDADDDVDRQIKDAFQRGNVVAVVADAWTLRLERYHNRMRTIDETGYMNCVVVVLWNDHDEETAAAETTLGEAVRLAFANRSAIHDPSSFFDRVSSVDELRERLGVALTRATARVVEHRQARRRAAISRIVIAKPELPVPVGKSS